MITLSIPTPPPSPIQRVSVVKLVPPLVLAAQYCGIVRRREGESSVCAVIHPYRTAHLYAAAFAVLFPLLLTEVWPEQEQQISEVTWADIAYISPKDAPLQLLVRTARIENVAAEIMWEDRDLTYLRTWEFRVQPVIELLNLIGA